MNKTTAVLFLLAAAGLLAACRPPEPRQPPPEVELARYEEAARGSEAIAGTYRLAEVDRHYLPVGMGMDGGCVIVASAGSLTLTADGRYELRLETFSECDGERRDHPPADVVVKEGLYSLSGAHLRFGDKILIAHDAPAPETTTGPEELVAAIFPDGRFAARGTYRAGRITTTMRDLRTLSFIGE